MDPHVFHEVYDRTPQKLNVWAGIFGDGIVGSIFILDDTLTGERYLEILENLVYPMLINIVEDDDRYSEQHLFFQQDGAPPHYGSIMALLLLCSFCYS